MQTSFNRSFLKVTAMSDRATNRIASQPLSAENYHDDIAQCAAFERYSLSLLTVNQKENKTRTNDLVGHQWDRVAPRQEARELGIERVWRRVVDFGEPTSGNGDSEWGHKRVSVARVTLLDGPSDMRPDRHCDP